MNTKGIQRSWRTKRDMHQSHCGTQHTRRDGCNSPETNTQNVDIGIVVHHWQECKKGADIVENILSVLQMTHQRTAI